MQLQAQDHQGAPEAGEAAWPSQQDDFRLPASRTKGINVCCLEPPSLWPLVTAALGNLHAETDSLKSPLSGTGRHSPRGAPSPQPAAVLP